MSGKHIFLVDDDKDDIFLMSTSLKRLEIEAATRVKITVFYSGQDALDFFDTLGEQENELPDCICVDINMPGMNGLELLKRLRRMRRLDVVPIYIVSTTNSDKTQQQALSFGASGAFAKPETMLGMQSIQRELLGIPE